MVMVIQASFRKNLAVFSSYDTILLSVWILLPSTTSPVCGQNVDSVLFHPAQEFCIKQICLLIWRGMAASLEDAHGQIPKVWPDSIPGRGGCHKEVVAPEREKDRDLERIKTPRDIDGGEDLAPHAPNHLVAFD